MPTIGAPDAQDTDGYLGGRYRLGRVIGGGGGGTVHEGTDVLLRRPVAIKEIRLPRIGSAAERELAEQRVMREARAAARLRHPGLVAVYDVLKAEGRSWIVMEYVDGVSLSDRIREHGRLAPEQVARIGISLAYALEAAHRAGVVHRDVKPGNVLVTADGQSRLTDFGIAVSHGDTTLTGAGTLVGSPAYIAPERVRGARAVYASDVWGLGATLFTAVEGAPPFEGEGVLAILTAVVEDRRHPFIHAESLRGVIEHMLDADPDRRPSLAEVRGDLHAVLDGLHGAGGWRRHGRRSALARRAARVREADRNDPWLEILADSHQPPRSDDADPVPVADSPQLPDAEDGEVPAAAVPDADGTVALGRNLELGGLGEPDRAAGSDGDIALDRGAEPDVDRELDVDGEPDVDRELDHVAESDLAAESDHVAEPAAGVEPESADELGLAGVADHVGEPDRAVESQPAGVPEYLPEPEDSAESDDLAGPDDLAEPADVDELSGNAGLVAAAEPDADADLAAVVAPTAGLDVPPDEGDPAAPRLAALQRRRGLMIAAAAVVGLAVVGTTLGLTTTGGGPAAPAAVSSSRPPSVVSTAPIAASTPRSSTSSSPRPATGAVTPSVAAAPQSAAATGQDYDTSLGSLIPSSTARAQAPAGFTTRSGSSGWSVAVPSDWSGSARGADRSVFAPASGYPELLVETQAAAGPSAIGAWQLLEPGVRASSPGYRLLSIRPADGQNGASAALWEFTFTSGGRVIHVLDLGVVRNGHGYALRWRVPEDDWAGQQDLMSRIFATFRPGP